MKIGIGIGVGYSQAGPANLINGSFDTDLTGWSPNNATLSLVSQRMRMVATVGGAFYASYTPVTVVNGATYRLTCSLFSETVTGNSFMRAGTTAFNNDLLELNNGGLTGIFTNTFVAAGTVCHITLLGGGGALAGEALEWDYVTLTRA